MDSIQKVMEQIPDHLREFVVEQNQTHYTPQDHAVWRYILRQLKNFLSTHAHHSYLDGLVKTGITVDEIPSIETMCSKLQEFGWSAVPVSGFIPPAAFMELQSLAVLPIATDMRSIDHILYTPAPDIVHEAAGHAPILVHPEYASYLKQYAQVAKKAIVSSEDLALYEAIRELSDIKEHPDSTPEQIQRASDNLEKTVASLSLTSEATLLGRMNWWTAEYGLIGSMEDPKIYGAGLLSSYGEAKSCLGDSVKKIPLTVKCVDYNYDITEPQPQLFVTPSFAHLKEVLHELSLGLAYKKGGLFGLQQAQKAKTVNTLQLNSGLQVSGRVEDFVVQDNSCIYYRLTGPCQLAIGGEQIPGHGKDLHSHGFSSPLGYIDGREDCLSWASEDELTTMGLIKGRTSQLQFESGVVVEGKVENFHRTRRGELCLISFVDCHVSFRGRTLFDPAWGRFDMAVGSQVESVFAGPADRKNYGMTDNFAQKRVPARNLKESDQSLNKIYAHIRELRQEKTLSETPLRELHQQLESHHPKDWLTRLELLEMCHQFHLSTKTQSDLEENLKELQKTLTMDASIISDGMATASRQL